MNESSLGKYSNDITILKLNPPPNRKLLFNQFNELTAESNKKNPENFINCRNLDIDEIQKMKIEPNSLSLFHINSCSLNKNFEDLEYLLKATNKTFDVIAISESRILKDTNLSKNINIYITALLNLLQLNLRQMEPYFILIINYLTILDKIFVFINQMS